MSEPIRPIPNDPDMLPDRGLSTWMIFILQTGIVFTGWMVAAVMLYVLMSS